MRTYDEIVKTMEAEYSAKSGYIPDEISDAGLRMRVLAGELYRIEAQLEWLKRQAFPQTADGEYLDLHGAQRGVARKEAQRATGVVTFVRYVPLSFDIVIPKGTVCAASGDSAFEYETTEETVIAAGTLEATAPAQALLGGSAGNAAPGYVNSVVTMVAGVEYVTNENAFTGGSDAETDDEYRQRVLAAYSRPVNCGNAGYYEELAVNTEGISLAQAVPRANGVGTVTVYVWGKNAAPSEETITQLSEKLNAVREIGVDITVQAAASSAVNITAYITPADGADFATVSKTVAEAITLWFMGRKIGEPFYVADLTRVILGAAPIKALELPASVRDISGVDGTLLVMGTVDIREG